MGASTIGMSAFRQVWTKRLADGTFDNYQILQTGLCTANPTPLPIILAISVLQ